MTRVTAILMALVTLAGPARAWVVSKAVGPLLKDAQQMIATKDYKGAMAKVNEAEAVKSNPDDEIVISQFRTVIATASSDPSQPHCTSARMGVTTCDGRAIGTRP